MRRSVHTDASKEGNDALRRRRRRGRSWPARDFARTRSPPPAAPPVQNRRPRGSAARPGWPARRTGEEGRRQIARTDRRRSRRRPPTTTGSRRPRGRDTRSTARTAASRPCLANGAAAPDPGFPTQKQGNRGPAATILGAPGLPGGCLRRRRGGGTRWGGGRGSAARVPPPPPGEAKRGSREGLGCGGPYPIGHFLLFGPPNNGNRNKVPSSK